MESTSVTAQTEYIAILFNLPFAPREARSVLVPAPSEWHVQRRQPEAGHVRPKKCVSTFNQSVSRQLHASMAVLNVCIYNMW